MTKTAEILRGCDPILARIIDTIPEPTIESTNDVFFDLMSCILEQQIHYRSTKRIFQKMLERADLQILTLENFDQFEQKGFANVKLSESKYETILRILDFFRDNQINWQVLSDDEIITHLSSIILLNV